MNQVTDVSFPEKTIWGKAVQIFQPNARHFVDENEIKRIFGHPDVANTPVAIYSIFGASRSGKSFLMSLLLQYLMKGKLRFSQNEDVMTEGFHWRGGMKRVTEGIWIWDVPFYMHSPEGKVAVFLMDTCGLSFQEDCIAFYLSMSLSSVQIYNVKNQMEMSMLQMLKSVLEYPGSGTPEQVKGRFQNLVLLVRDWYIDDDDDYYEFGFKGGERHWKKIAKFENHSEEFTSVIRKLIHAFESITCCLMPYPGRNVSRGMRVTSILKIRDINEEFLSTFQEFANNLFSPEQISTKKMTGLDIINRLVSIYNPKVIGPEQSKSPLMRAAEMFFKQLFGEGSGEGTKVDQLQKIGQESENSSSKQFVEETNSSLEVVDVHTPVLQQGISNEEKAVYQSALLEMKSQEDRYKAVMEAKCFGYVMSDKEFEEAHQDAHDKAMHIFDQSKTRKNTKSNEIRKKLMNNIEERKNFLKMTRTQVATSLEKARNSYTASMRKKLLESYLEVETFEEEHRKSEKEARKIIETQSSSIVEKCIPHFSKFIQTEHQQMKEWNEDLKQFTATEVEKMNKDFGDLPKIDASSILCDRDKAMAGSGSFGKVLVGFCTTLRKNVATKVFNIMGGTIETSPEWKIITEEFELLGKAKHENIVLVYGLVEWGFSAGIVMEFCKGGNLNNLLLNNRIKLGFSLRVRFLADIANALAFCHSLSGKRLIHNDVKPDNIVLTEYLVCKLCDFGGAELTTVGSTDLYDPLAKSKKDKCQFTPFYTAPERLENQNMKPTKYLDVYAIGVMIFVVFARELPYPFRLSNKDEREHFYRDVIEGKRPDCEVIEEWKSTLNKSELAVAENLLQMMRHCWGKAPSSRPTMAAVSRDLQQHLEKQSVSDIMKQASEATKQMTPFKTPEFERQQVPLHQFSTHSMLFADWSVAGNAQSTAKKSL